MTVPPPPRRKPGERTADYALSACTCEIPEPIADGDADGAIACAECGERLNVDTEGQPFRRWPGDLTSGLVALARAQRRALEEMRELVAELPEREQKRLARLPKDRFATEARKAIDRWLRPTAEVSQDTPPHVKRRLQRAIADGIDSAPPAQ